MSLLGFFTIVKFHVCPHSKGDAQSIITFFRKRLQTTILCWFEIPESLAILSCQDIGTEILILVSGVDGVSADTIHLLLSDRTMSIFLRGILPDVCVATLLSSDTQSQYSALFSKS